MINGIDRPRREGCGRGLEIGAGCFGGGLIDVFDS